MHAHRPAYLLGHIGLDQLRAPIAVVAADEGGDADVVEHASTTFSSWPALSASVALCSRWFIDTNRCLKKSMSVGLSGIFGSRGSAPMRKYLPGLRACSSAPPT